MFGQYFSHHYLLLIIKKHTVGRIRIISYLTFSFSWRCIRIPIISCDLSRLLHQMVLTDRNLTRDQTKLLRICLDIVFTHLFLSVSHIFLIIFYSLLNSHLRLQNVSIVYLLILLLLSFLFKIILVIRLKSLPQNNFLLVGIFMFLSFIEFFLHLSLKNFRSFIIDSILDLSIQLLFSVLTFHELLLTVDYGFCDLHVFLNLRTHNEFLILLLSLLHCLIFSHEFVLVSLFVTDFSLRIVLHVDNVVLCLLFASHFILVELFIFHHEYFVKFCSIIKSLLSFYYLIPV
jgi:hypothetical protein